MQVEYDGSAVGFLVGDVGRGVAAIMEMVSHTRLDCALGSAGLMRQAVREAMHHTRQRRAFGTTLASAPAMRVLLHDLNVESVAAVALALHVAESFDEATPPVGGSGLLGGDGSEKGSITPADGYRRLATAVAKFWVTKRALPVVGECLEAVGGNAYTESERWRFGRWLRQAPLNSLWEGAGNVVCLDVQVSLCLLVS